MAKVNTLLYRLDFLSHTNCKNSKIYFSIFAPLLKTGPEKDETI